MSVLIEHGRSVWKAGVAAVASEKLVRRSVHRSRGMLNVAGHEIPLAALNRIAVVGAGKAGAGMAAALVP